MVLGVLGESHYLGGVRLAQTLLGPLNTLFAAFTTNLFVDGVTRESYRDTGHLIRLGRRLMIQLAVVAGLFVPTIVIGLWITGISLRAVDNKSLIVGTALVGTLGILYNTSAVDAIILRMIGRNSLATGGRAVLAVASITGFGVGYVVGGVDGSLIAGFITSAVANPICFVVPASIVYRTYRTSAESPNSEEINE
jgi:hypothetical protein